MKNLLLSGLLIILTDLSLGKSLEKIENPVNRSISSELYLSPLGINASVGMSYDQRKRIAICASFDTNLQSYTSLVGVCQRNTFLDSSIYYEFRLSYSEYGLNEGEVDDSGMALSYSMGNIFSNKTKIYHGVEWFSLTARNPGVAVTIPKYIMGLKF